MKRTLVHLPVSALVLAFFPGLGSAQTSAIQAETPEQLVSTYESLADGILALQAAEQKLVESILATTYTHAQATLAAARAKLQAGEPARTEVERLAALVSQLGNEGDASVAAVRKRLLEGGHHHHSSAEEQGAYDPGFVVVTRAAKKVFLDAATAIGKLAASPEADALNAQWVQVQRQYGELMKASPR